MCVFGIVHFLNVTCGREARLYSELASSFAALNASVSRCTYVPTTYLHVPEAVPCLYECQMRCSLDVNSEVALLYS